MSKTTMIAGALAVVAVGAWYFSTQQQPSTQSTELVPATQSDSGSGSEASDAAIDTSSVVEMRLGNPDSPVTVVEYASFTCPHCATFHASTFKQLKAEYIDTGKINFIYRDVYFDKYGLWASAVARCAGPDKFFGISGLIYDSQSEWTRAGGGDPNAIVAELRKIGRLAGLDEEKVESCLQDGERLKTLVAWYQENAERDEVRSTPSLMINGEMHQNMAYAELKELIEKALGDS